LTRVERRWRVAFAEGAPSAQLVSLGFEPDGPGGWLLAAPDAPALNAALDRARAAGALVVALERASKDLEEALAEAVEPAG